MTATQTRGPADSLDGTPGGRAAATPIPAVRSGETPGAPDRAAVPEWMPGVWDFPDADGFPARHHPARPHADIWVALCDAFCFEAHPLATVIDRCLPCVACELAEEARRVR